MGLLVDDADEDITAILYAGELTLTGRLVDSSNNALVGVVDDAGVTLQCVYKPIQGERPLWDFPHGNLAAREVAAYEVSRVAGWDCVPVTVLRQGPFGLGMVQQWITEVSPTPLVDVFPVDHVPAGWASIAEFSTAAGETVTMAHSLVTPLATIAGFDLVINNADRKGAHLLPVGDKIWSVDHGLTFHQQPKLRTVLWGWAGDELPTTVQTGLERLKQALSGPTLPDKLAALITIGQYDSLCDRITALMDTPVFPLPPADRPAIAWPPL